MKVGIVGGGFMGLVLAHEISKTNRLQLDNTNFNMNHNITTG